MLENEWRLRNRRAMLCLLIGTVGAGVVLPGAFYFNWNPAFTLTAMVLLVAAPLAVSAWLFLLVNRKLENQLRESQKAGAVGRLAGDVAHDFNNLLAGILGAAEVLEPRVGETGVEREMVNTIVAAARQAGQLSASLLVAARNHADANVPAELQAKSHQPAIVAPCGTATTPEPPRGHGLILLIDDEATIRALASMVLVQLGYEVIVASCGRKGIALFEKERGRIRAVVLDMVMPEMSGMDVLRELKRIDPQVKVAIAAGYITDEIRADLQSTGVAAIIQKPYRMSEIGTVLAGILGAEKPA